MKSTLLLACMLVPFGLAHTAAPSPAKAISQYGITWQFDKKYPSGQFANGDHWVVGPVKVVGISTDLHAPGFAPKPGEDGSMVNPGTNSKQGYDSRLNSYEENLNVRGLIT